MSEKLEIRLAGAGGQGLILASIILGTVAAIEGKYVAQSQSYGPEARGGASRSELIISDNPIDYPLVEKPDLLLALTGQAYDKYGYYVKEESLTIVDDSVDFKVHPGKIFSLPILEKARTEIHNPISANIICIGIVAGAVLNFQDKLFKEVILQKIPRTKPDTLIKAFHIGKTMIKYFR